MLAKPAPFWRGRIGDRCFVATVVAIVATSIGPLTGSEVLSMFSLPGFAVLSLLSLLLERLHVWWGGADDGLAYYVVGYVGNLLVWWIGVFFLISLVTRLRKRSATQGR
jgi:hypothetical protein